MSNGDADRAIEGLARRQHGVFTRAQAMRAGLSPRMIERRLTSGVWLPLARGIYAHSAHPPTWRRQAKAAELSIAGGVISHRAAAALHAFVGFRPARIEVTTTAKVSGRSSLAVVHRRRTAPAITVDRIATTTIARTIVDVAGQVSAPQLASTFDDLVVSRRVRIDDVRAEYERLASERCRGVAAVRRLLERRVDGEVPPANELERVLRRVLDDPRLPPSEHQAALPWWPTAPQRVDAVIPALRRIVEADGRRWHTREADFERDRARDHLAQRHGYEVTRFTYRQLVEAPEYARDVLLDIAGRATLSS